jgi:hypothetical protein
MGRCNGSGGAPVPWGSRESERPASGGFLGLGCDKTKAEMERGCKLVS